MLYFLLLNVTHSAAEQQQQFSVLKKMLGFWSLSNFVDSFALNVLWFAPKTLFFLIFIWLFQFSELWSIFVLPITHHIFCGRNFFLSTLFSHTKWITFLFHWKINKNKRKLCVLWFRLHRCADSNIKINENKVYLVKCEMRRIV